jgi:hypothetical protein
MVLVTASFLTALVLTGLFLTGLPVVDVRRGIDADLPF